MSDFCLPAPVPLCLRALSGYQSQLCPWPERLGAQWTQIPLSANKWCEFWIPHSLRSPTCSTLPLRSQEGLSSSCPQFYNFPNMHPFSVSALPYLPSRHLTCTAKQMTSSWTLDPGPASRRCQTKTDALYVNTQLCILNQRTMNSALAIFQWTDCSSFQLH